jgi:hypothetical protein
MAPRRRSIENPRRRVDPAHLDGLDLRRPAQPEVRIGRVLSHHALTRHDPSQMAAGRHPEHLSRTTLRTPSSRHSSGEITRDSVTLASDHEKAFIFNELQDLQSSIPGHFCA